MEFVPDAAFEMNEPTVISETIDGEVVVINLASGTYYSLKNSAAAIWSGIEQTARLSYIADMLRANFDVGVAEAEAAVLDLVTKLHEEGLVRPAGEVRELVSPGALTNGALKAAPFILPTLERFTDMEAMLLLDPVHDVDEEGWPHLPGADGQVNA